MQPQRDRLDWIARNRQVRSRAVPIGECLRDRQGVFETRKAIRQAVAAFVDEEFAAYCALGEVDGGKVVILVGSPTALMPIRLKWLTDLRGHLVRTCRPFGARRLEFRVGEGDDRFRLPPDVGPARSSEGADAQ